MLVEKQNVVIWNSFYINYFLLFSRYVIHETDVFVDKQNIWFKQRNRDIMFQAKYVYMKLYIASVLKIYDDN